MKSHHTTTLHQFTLLSKRSSTSFEESSHKFKKSLKKHIYTFWKDSSYSIISPILEIILCQSYIGWKFRYYTTIILHETDELQLLFSRHTKLSSVTPCLWMVFNFVIEPFTTFFCFFYSIQCIPTSLYSGKHVYKLTTTCAKAKNDVYLCARSFSLRMMTEKKPISIINLLHLNSASTNICLWNWFHEKTKILWDFFEWMMKVPVST